MRWTLSERSWLLLLDVAASLSWLVGYAFLLWFDVRLATGLLCWRAYYAIKRERAAWAANLEERDRIERERAQRTH